MDGIRRTLTAMALVSFLFAMLTLGCRGSESAEGTTPATLSSEETDAGSARPTRGEVSCHLHSCAPPKYCNPDSGICELLSCNDSRDCPYGYKCDFSKNVCR